MAAHDGHEFGSVGRTTLAEPVRLDVLVQQFIGVQFRAVARHPNQPQPRRVAGCKACGCSGLVHRMPVHDQRDRAGDLFEQPLHERHKHWRLEFALKHHEGQSPSVGDRRDHVAAEALPGRPDDRGLAQRGVARSGHVVTAQAHLVAPIDRGPVTPGLPRNRRILFRQPLGNRRVVPLIRPPQRLLGPYAPGPEVAACRGERYRQTLFPCNQACHRWPRPEIERQLPHDQATDALRVSYA